MNYRTKSVVILAILFFFPSCKERVGPENSASQFYRNEMRNLVQEISVYAKSMDPEFIVITQNGQELLTKNGRSNGRSAQDYLDRIDGVAQEHVFFGLDGYDVRTSDAYRDYILGFLELARKKRLKVLVTDYCLSPIQVNESHARNQARDFLSFAASTGDYDLDRIPEYPETPVNVNSENITRLNQANNFLYLINTNAYSTRRDLLAALKTTDFDVLLIDPFFGPDALKNGDISSLKVKSNGGKRLVIAYMNIGAAEEFRYYWQNDWEIGNPSWLAARYSDPRFYNEYWVKYWEPGWQDLLVGNDNSYVNKILDAGFDGVYLDNLESYNFFESIQ